jgi:hypothetical protein
VGVFWPHRSFPAAIVLHCLRTFSEACGEDSEEAGEAAGDPLATAYALDKHKVRFRFDSFECASRNNAPITYKTIVEKIDNKTFAQNYPESTDNEYIGHGTTSKSSRRRFLCGFL